MSRRRMSGWALSALCAVLLIGPEAAPAAKAPLPCSDPVPAGGEWPAYGNDLSNSRDQAAEDTISPDVAATLTPAWTFNSTSTGDAGGFNSTPVVVGGCVYIGSANGGVFALDSETGTPVWTAAVDVPATGLGGTIVGSPVIAGDRVIFAINELSAPRLVAYNRHTGALSWQSKPMTTYEGAYTNASPAVYNGIVFLGYSVEEGDPNGQGGFGLFDARSGKTIKVTETIPEADQQLGYAGGTIWSSTPAIDGAGGFAYAGVGNPFSKKLEHDHTNAIIKIDIRRSSPRFGQVVDSYKGNIDQFSDLLQELSQPTCDAVGEDPNLQLFLGNSAGCLQLDLDFGSAPNLFRTSTGDLLVGELQKSGVYHAARADTMDPAWTASMGLSCAACNADSTSFDGTRIAGVGTPGGVLVALDRDSGGLQWASPLVDGVHYQGVSTANGVTYTIDGNGIFSAFDSATGVPVLKRAMWADAGGESVNFSSAGIAIAEHTVFAATATLSNGGQLVAYRPAG